MLQLLNERANVLGKTFVNRLLSYLGAAAAVSIAVAALACSGPRDATGPGESATTPPPSPTATATPNPTGTSGPTFTPSQPGPTVTSTQTETPDSDGRSDNEGSTGYDSTENMYRLFSGRDHDSDDTREAIRLAVSNDDKSMVPIIIEMLRFFWVRELAIETNTALSTLTGHELDGRIAAWNEWMEWLGRNADDYRPPDGYLQWKSNIMNLIDLRFGEFLAPAAEGSRINVFEIAWGGVRPDGIPDLQNSPVLPADAQDYLQPSDRVFGVSINGEHRAYPLRIVNAHEMANDVLGGEPIALAY